MSHKPGTISLGETGEELYASSDHMLGFCSERDRIVAAGVCRQSSWQRRQQPSVYLDRPLSLSGEDTCTPGFLWQGAGNPNTTFQRKRNVDAGIELGIKGIVRQGPDIRSTYVDDDGLVHIEVPAGAQPGNPARAAWNFTYSFDVSLDPGNPTLNSYSAELWIDLDPSSDTDYLKLNLAKLGSPAAAGPCRVSRTPTVMVGKRRTRSSFLTTKAPTASRRTRRTCVLRGAIDTNPRMRGIQPYTFGPGQFDVVLKIKRKLGSKSETELHVVFDVVTAPSQTP